MITTISQTIEGVELITPSTFQFAQTTLMGYPNYCGPSTGFLEEAIPDTVNGVPFGPACHIHDVEWSLPRRYKSWNHFHASNSRFLRNLLALTDHFQEQLTFADYMETERAALRYYKAVDLLGGFFYWRG